MKRDAVRSTVYIEPALHHVLRLKAATLHRSMSELVNDAVRAALQADEAGPAALAERERETGISYRDLLARFPLGGPARASSRTSAEALLTRWRRLPPVDPVRFRADLDAVLESSL